MTKGIEVEATGNTEVDALQLVLAGLKTAPSVTSMIRIAEFALSVAKDRHRNHLFEAWAIIANAHGGNWDKADPEWVEAAKRFRDETLNSTTRVYPE